MRLLLVAAACAALVLPAAAQDKPASPLLDSDHDGLSDALESSLLTQFQPLFETSAHDCSAVPARFEPGVDAPRVLLQDGSLYGQATPDRDAPNKVELHYYHLWQSDCGQMSHPLDAEHVSALIERDHHNNWRALYWYAAAHEDTVCDASQIARASTLKAESAGPAIYISYGKHAAYLDRRLCAHGCGGDSCADDVPLASAALINLGEADAPINGALWIHSPAWPLETKLTRSDFARERTARVDQLPASDIAWANPDLRPVQAVLLGGNDALGGGATGIRATNTALVIADTHTSNALHRAKSSTGHALGKAYRSVFRTLSPEPHPADAPAHPKP